MMIDVFVDEWVILTTTVPMHSVTAAMNLATLHRAAPTRFLPQEHHVTKTDFNQGINIPTPKGTDHTPPIRVLDMGDLSANHNPTAIPTMTGVAVSEGIHQAPHPATAVAHAALQLMDAPITICTMTHPTGKVTPHSTLTTSPTGLTHTTIPQTRASLDPATPIILHRKYSQEKTSHTKDFQPLINHTVPILSSSRTPHQILPWIQTATLIL